MILIFKMFTSNAMAKLGVMFIAGAIGLVALTSYNIEAANGVPTEREIIVEMHKMANTYIVASEIRGKQEMTQKRIAKLIDIVQTQLVEDPKAYPHQENLLPLQRYLKV